MNEWLEWTRERYDSFEQREVLKAKIILLASEGKENKDIAREFGVSGEEDSLNKK